QALHHHRRAARGEGQGADRQWRRRVRRARLRDGLRRRNRRAGLALLHRARQSRRRPRRRRLRQRAGGAGPAHVVRQVVGNRRRRHGVGLHVVRPRARPALRRRGQWLAVEPLAAQRGQGRQPVPHLHPRARPG
ncbi:MAG: hypothetical protein DIU62_007085, partial [Pseudomonadota bacterium]